jgi:hypothetical protein
MLIFLDAGPLGMLTSPAATAKNTQIKEWMDSQIDKGAEIVVPEIADYEVRRSLILEKLNPGLARLNAFTEIATYVPIDTATMRTAADLWAMTRALKPPQPTAPDEELDCDAVLAAQAITTSNGQEEVIIATDNIGHLSRFETSTVKAMKWTDF